MLGFDSLRLILTHLDPDEDPAPNLAGAQGAFPGPGRPRGSWSGHRPGGGKLAVELDGGGEPVEVGPAEGGAARHRDDGEVGGDTP
jgi:hypothetical protein